MHKLQVVQNLALRWAFNIKWDQYISNKKLYNDYKHMFTPVNQTLYWRARSLSYGIENDDTGDVKQRKAIRAL